MFRGWFASQRNTVTARVAPPRSAVDSFVASTVAGRGPTPEEAWKQLEQKYPETYAAFQRIRELRPDLLTGIEYKSATAMDAAETVYYLGFASLAAARTHDKVPYPLTVSVGLADQRLYGAPGCWGHISDSDAAKATYEGAERNGFIAIETVSDLSGPRRVLVAGAAQYNPQPEDRPPPGRPQLCLVGKEP